ncbi:UDP-glycosyltransferase 85A2 [Platanthera guangdongensis]|uniref:UDP-glycosyltransferase 85A2 n=1 Tax=Platanthera guangdongensis TaxID=2320717 RepID=A0ABR2LIH2_9ASPA
MNYEISHARTPFVVFLVFMEEVSDPGEGAVFMVFVMEFDLLADDPWSGLGAGISYESYLTNGYLQTRIDWIPGMAGIRLQDIPSFICTTDADDPMLNYDGNEAQNARTARALILNTFDPLEIHVLQALSSIFPNLYPVGPLPLLLSGQFPSEAASICSNLWKEDTTCLQWLDAQETSSVLYVNFGSITVLTASQIREFAWGLKISGFPFLWILRPDLVRNGEVEMAEITGDLEAGGKGKVARWCVQEEVLAHAAVGAFLTHCGWNSTLESVCGGVPVICWPFFAEQPTNCKYACGEWGIGVEIEGEVKRDKVAVIVREVMGGEKGEEMRKRAAKWREAARKAAEIGGSSSESLEKLIGFLRNGCT